MIDITKTYRTRCGYPVRIYVTDGGGEYPVHGAYFSQGKWFVFCWSIMGEAHIGRTSELDLIEVKPRIQRTYYINVYDSSVGGDVVYYTRGDADRCAMSDRLACIEITIDCEEGEGL